MFQVLTVWIISVLSTENGHAKVARWWDCLTTRTWKKPDTCKARTSTAWAIFSYQAFYARTFYHQPDLIDPPQVQLPDASMNPKWYGEIWIEYPHTQAIFPTHLAHKMQAEVALHTVENEMGWLLYGPRKSSRPVAPADIVMLKQQLDRWLATLPDALTPKQVTLPFHLSLQ
jgi:hypothetical protein